MPDQNNKSHPGLAAVFSFIFSGLGQIYNGQIFKGLLIIFFSILSMLILIIAAVFIGFALVGRVFFPGQIASGLVIFSISLIFICIIGAYSILDAYRTAKK